MFSLLMHNILSNNYYFCIDLHLFCKIFTINDCLDLQNDVNNLMTCYPLASTVVATQQLTLLSITY